MNIECTYFENSLQTDVSDTPNFCRIRSMLWIVIERHLIDFEFKKNWNNFKTFTPKTILKHYFYPLYCQRLIDKWYDCNNLKRRYTGVRSFRENRQVCVSRKSANIISYRVARIVVPGPVETTNVSAGRKLWQNGKI